MSGLNGSVLQTSDGGFLEMAFSAAGVTSVTVQPIGTLPGDTSCLKYWRAVALADPPTWYDTADWASAAKPKLFVLEFVATGQFLALDLAKNVTGTGAFNGSPTFQKDPTKATAWTFPEDLQKMYLSGAINGLRADPSNTDIAKLNPRTPIAVYFDGTKNPNFALLARNVTFTVPKGKSGSGLPTAPEHTAPTTIMFMPVPQIGHGCGHPLKNTGHHEDGHPVYKPEGRPGQPSDCRCLKPWNASQNTYNATYGVGSPCSGGIAFGIWNPAIPQTGGTLLPRAAEVVDAASTFFLADAPDVQCVVKAGDPSSLGAGATGHQNADNYVRIVAIVIGAVGGLLLIVIIVLIVIVVKESRKTVKTAVAADKATGGKVAAPRKAK